MTDSLDPARAIVARVYAEEHRTLVDRMTARTRSRALAEDLVQATWLKVLAALHRGSCALADVADVRAFVYTVARNTFLDECTRKHAATRTTCVAPDDLDQLADPGRGSPDDEVHRAQVATLVRRALDALPREQRAVAEQWSSGASARQMAARSAVPVDTVLSRKKYAVARMRRELAPLRGAV